MAGKKKLIIGGSVAAVVIAAVIVILLLIFNKEDAYRVIKVLEIDGTAAVERENVGELQAYSGMALQSGDKISVDANSMLVLQMDDDKYAYIEQNSILSIMAEGTSRDSKTTIQLERGAITCHVDGKLSDSSSYEVHTQNSIMAIRGTVLRVQRALYSGNSVMQQGGILSKTMPVSIQNCYNSGRLSDGYTRVTVFEGDVSTTLLNIDGTTGKTITLDAGKESWIGSNPTENFFVEEETDIYSGSLPAQTLRALLSASANNASLSIDDSELNNLSSQISGQQTYMVYFYANGQLFGRQEVKAGSLVIQPQLKPTQNGYWNIDFTKPVNDDTEVYWVTD